MWATQLRVWRALLARELLTRYGRHNIGFAWVFVEPILFTSAIAALWYFTRHVAAPGISVVAFALTGYSSVLLWRNTASRCTGAIRTNWALLYHRMVTPLDIFVARALLEIAAATTSLCVLSVVFCAAAWMDPPQNLLAVLYAWFLQALFGLAFGVFIGTLSEMSEVFDRFWHMLTYLLFPLSGAMFLADWLPTTARAALLWLPMVHGVEMLRGGWFGPAVATHGSGLYLLATTLAVAWAGMLLLRRHGRRIEVPG